jgi:UDP-glucose 4-epimerase
MHPAALPWRGRRVLVTGAGGLLGVPVARALVAAGAAVVAQVGARPHPDAGLPQLRATFPADAEALLADVRPDAVVHLAAPVDLAAPASALAAGITEATARLHAAAGRALFVNVGTCDEYGAQPGPLHEGLPPAPQSAYAALKAEAGAAVLARAAAQGTAALHLRPFRCLGPGDRSSVLAAAAAAPPGLLRWGARPRRPGEPSRFVSDSRAAAAQVGPIGPAPLPALLAPYLPPAAAPPPGGRPA